jgi:hypothetical protein
MPLIVRRGSDRGRSAQDRVPSGHHLAAYLDELVFRQNRRLNLAVAEVEADGIDHSILGLPLAPLYKVENTFARLGMWRRLSRCYEQTAVGARTWMEVACVAYLCGRLRVEPT